MKNLDIKKATLEDLVWFAKNVMAIEDADSSMSADSLRGKIKKAGWDKPNIQVREDEDMVEATEVESPAPEAKKEIDEIKVDALPVESDSILKRRAEVSGKDDPKIKIFLPKQAGQSGGRAISVGVNGTHILIPREQECEVPLRYVLALKDAVSTEYDFDDEGSVTNTRDVQLYPFNVIEGREHLA
tara:strand:- start:212 stop:769 length:558 start_codon:yes stop_codon:yes gene_type:complete